MSRQNIELYRKYLPTAVKIAFRGYRGYEFSSEMEKADRIARAMVKMAEKYYLENKDGHI